MNVSQKAELDALHRIQVFFTQNAAVLGAVPEAPPKPALDHAVTALEAKAGDQHAAQVYAASQTAEKQALRDDLLVHHMHPIAAIARASLAGTPQISKFRMPSKAVDDVRLVAAVVAMAQAAALYTQVFLDHKLPQDFIAQLQVASDAVQKAIATRNAATQTLKASTQSVVDGVTNARNAVKVLSPLVVKQLKGRTDLLAAWQQAKRIQTKPGVPRKSKKTKAAASTPASTTTVSSATPTPGIPAAGGTSAT